LAIVLGYELRKREEDIRFLRKQLPQRLRRERAATILTASAAVIDAAVDCAAMAVCCFAKHYKSGRGADRSGFERRFGFCSYGIVPAMCNKHH
jgi:hypothetical protein